MHNCTSPNDVTYHNFPSDPILAEQWLKICSKTFIPKTAKVCSSHFSSESYKSTPKELKSGIFKRKYLKRGSLPTACLPVPPPVPPPAQPLPGLANGRVLNVPPPLPGLAIGGGVLDVPTPLPGLANGKRLRKVTNKYEHLKKLLFFNLFKIKKFQIFFYAPPPYFVVTHIFF